MIRNMSELLMGIREKGVTIIEPFLAIGHNPTIGDMYEGLTKELVEKTLFDGFDIRVSSGKITNSAGKLSNQIDCMIVVGNGKQIPFTHDYVYDVNNVIAVIEVKKNLYKSDMLDAYNNLHSVIDVVKPEKEIPISMFRNSYRQIIGKELPNEDKVEDLATSQYQIYHALITECFSPIRIIWGYSGFVTEKSLRNKFAEMIENIPGGKVFGAVSLPSLVICGNNTLIKTNGIPYVMRTKGNETWGIYASYNANPILILLEIIWSKLCYLFNIDETNLFDCDITMENLHPFILATGGKEGWEYQLCELNAKQSATTEWKPSKISEVEHVILTRLCNSGSVDITDESLLSYLDGMNQTIHRIISHLEDERLVYVDGNHLKLLTDQMQLIIAPDGNFYAGENRDGRMLKWVALKKKT